VNPPLTNLQKWQYYNENLFSPETYITVGWLYLISSALQRRVWYGDLKGQPLFPNLFIILVGPPAVGKGLVLGECTKLLKHHTYIQGTTSYDEVANKKQLFPMGPNDITYEKLCDELSLATARLTYKDNDKEKIYTHASMSFVLEELESLFKKRDNTSLTKFFLQTYDCKDYDYKTKHQGENCIKHPCTNILAGCVPDTIVELAKMKIFNDGFVSRTIFIYENKPRLQTFFLKQPDENQFKAQAELLDHIKLLSKLHGNLTLEDGVESYLENWFKTIHAKQEASAHPRMQTYYGRKRVHIMKLAACYHFSEDTTSMVITLEDFKKAIKLLEELETNMSIGFTAAGRNTLNLIYTQILRFIKSHHNDYVSKNEIFINFFSDLTLDELDRILLELCFMGKLRQKEDKFAAT